MRAPAGRSPSHSFLRLDVCTRKGFSRESVKLLSGASSKVTLNPSSLQIAFPIKGPSPRTIRELQAWHLISRYSTVSEGKSTFVNSDPSLECLKNGNLDKLYSAFGPWAGRTTPTNTPYTLQQYPRHFFACYGDSWEPKRYYSIRELLLIRNSCL